MKLEDMLFHIEELRSLVSKELIRPLGAFLEKEFRKNTILQNVIPLKDIHADFDEYFSSFKKDNRKTRVIFMGYNPETDKLHFIPLNEKYNKTPTNNLIEYFIAKTPDYLDQFNPLEVLAALPEKRSGLTQMVWQKNASGQRRIIFSKFAQLDPRSYEKTSFDILFGIKRTLYIPIPNPDLDDSYFTEDSLGVLLLMSDLKEEEYAYPEEYKNFMLARKNLLDNFPSRNGTVSPDKINFTPIKDEISKLKKESQQIKSDSEKIQELINSQVNVQNFYNSNEIKSGVVFLKKLLLQTLFIYNDYINLMDSYICMEAERKIK